MEQKGAYETALILTTMFNLGLQNLFITTVLTFIFAIPVMREQALNFLCGKPMTLNLHKIAPMQEEKDAYFNNLRSMWATPRRSSQLPKI